MNQGKLKVVKQEMARVNIDNLGISELKWTAMGEFDSDDDYINYTSIFKNAWQKKILYWQIMIAIKKLRILTCICSMDL